MVKTSKLSKAQQTLWNLLTDDEKKQHVKAYKQAKSDLENGITKTVIGASAPTDSIKVAPNAPSALYFPMNESYGSQMNIVGEVRTLASNVTCNGKSDTVVVFESADIKILLELYFGNNILI